MPYYIRLLVVFVAAYLGSVLMVAVAGEIVLVSLPERMPALLAGAIATITTIWYATRKQN